VGERIPGAPQDPVDDGHVIGEPAGPLLGSPRLFADGVVVPVEQACPDAEIQSPTRQVVDGQGLARQRRGRAQDGIADQGADADTLSGGGSQRQKAPAIEPGTATVAQIRTVVGNDHLIESEFFHPTKQAGMVE
jgi:hypothetical protein